MDPIMLFAKKEAEIATYGIAPPTPWPWAINSDGTTDMALRIHQLEEFLADLRKATPQEVVVMGRETAEEWRKRNEARSTG